MGKSLDDIVGEAAEDDDLDIDFSGAQDFAEILGDRHCRIVDLETRDEDGDLLVSSRKGERMVKVTWEVLEGDDAGRSIYERWMIEGAGSGITRDKLASLGFASDGERLQLKKSELIGTEAILEMGYQKKCGPKAKGFDKQYTEVKKIKPLPSKAAGAKKATGAAKKAGTLG